MRHPNSHQVASRSLRFTGSLPSMLQSITLGGPLYVHARNWMVELASIIHLSDLVVDEESNTALFPEAGLHLSLGAVEAVHGVEIDYRSRHALALEIATPGEPRAVSIVAIPNISDLEHFRSCMNHHPSEILREEEYRRWREEFIVLPVICPCCQSAAEERRAHPENNPLTRVFCHAIEENLPLLCRVVSPIFGFSTWLTPKNLQLANGILGAISEDGRSMLEVDFGVCHTLRIVCRLLDDEPFSEINLYDSVGELHLSIAARGWDKEAIWRGLCG